MIINNNAVDLSLREKDCANLRELILENPGLPLLIFAGEDAWQGEYSYNQVYASKGRIEHLTLYNNIWMDEDDYSEKLANDLCEEDEYKDMSDKEYFRMIDEKVANTEFCEAIVIYVG